MSSTLPVPPAARLTRNPAAAPDPLASRLAYAGLAPFVLGMVLAWLVEHEDAHTFVLHALNTYAAVVLSFIGALHWGLAMRAQSDGPPSWTWGVAPSLVGWVAALMPAGAGLVIQGAMLLTCYFIDRRAYPAHHLAGWLTLRFRLTVVSTMSCFLAAAFA